MAVGVTVGSITDELGAASFVHAFFSTISAHCEPDGWGTSFPHLLNALYQGRLAHQNAPLALDRCPARSTSPRGSVKPLTCRSSTACRSRATG